MLYLPRGRAFAQKFCPGARFWLPKKMALGIDWCMSRKDRKHMFANMFFFKLSWYGFALHIVVMIASTHFPQETFAISLLTSLKTSLKHRPKHVLIVTTIWRPGFRRCNCLCKLCCNGVARKVAGRSQRVTCSICNLSHNFFCFSTIAQRRARFYFLLSATTAGNFFESITSAARDCNV